MRKQSGRVSLALVTRCSAAESELESGLLVHSLWKHLFSSTKPGLSMFPQTWPFLFSTRKLAKQRADTWICFGNAGPGQRKWIFSHFTNPMSCLETTVFLCLLKCFFFFFVRSLPHICHRPSRQEGVTGGTRSIPVPGDGSMFPSLGPALKFKLHHESGWPQRPGMGGKQSSKKDPCFFGERTGAFESSALSSGFHRVLEGRGGQNTATRTHGNYLNTKNK